MFLTLYKVWRDTIFDGSVTCKLEPKKFILLRENQMEFLLLYSTNAVKHNLKIRDDIKEDLFMVTTLLCEK